MADEDDNFFSRWSRRKVQVRSGEPLPKEPVPPVARAIPPVGAPVSGMAAGAGERDAAASDPPAEQPASPPPTLEDVAQLTPESDFKAFVARGVSPEVRNAAVKKLFADPHFNVMDGLDIYIDDYSKPNPLSAAMMAKMVGAQFLKLVDDPNEVKAGSPAASAVPVPDNPPEDIDTPTTEPAELPKHAIAAADEPPQASQDDHVDLQLQPDHAPERESAGRGTG